ncbi:MAG TPA: thymidine phosphorylase [Bdellovibrionales bacterium]|nr:thymidine phosphorylase [Bdellovibrionales bacterium]
MAELIKKKRSGHQHTTAEISFIISGFTSGNVPDYQMAAWLMAVYFNGMTPHETAELTRIMLHSGRTLDFSHLPGVAVDKHSTGGVGDKTSMILAPIAAAAGARVPMIAGRGLGHTGGTLDKLEAIPGFRVDLSLDTFIKQIETLGVSIIGQTEEICPADKKIYALRDVTATVESYPLICASIMSKKIAEGIGALVLDVKFGSGAFMRTIEEADTLATKLMEIGTAHGKRVSTVLTSMEQPLGRFIGNGLEIGECVSILRNEEFLGRPPEDFADTRELSLALAGQMVWLSGVAKTEEEGLAKAKQALESGAAWTKFKEICLAQGGRLDEMTFDAQTVEVMAPESGFISALNTEQIGYAALTLGAGRLKTTDPIDYAAGIEIHKKLGERVEKGERLYTLFHSAPSAPTDLASVRLLSATKISLQKPSVPDLIARKRVN